MFFLFPLHLRVGGLITLCPCPPSTPAVFKKISLGIIPAGTGNGLASSFGFAKSPKAAAEAITSASTAPLDILRVTNQAGEEKAMAALSVSWGFVGGEIPYGEFPSPPHGVSHVFLSSGKQIMTT